MRRPVIVTPGVTASTVFGIHDMFASAGRDWAFLTAGEAGTPRARAMLVARNTRPLQVANGVWLRAETSFRDCPTPDIVHVPELFVPAEAKQIMETTDRPIEEVATEVGCEDDSFFRRLFRRKVGLTPRGYRQWFQSLRRTMVVAENGRG